MVPASAGTRMVAAPLHEGSVTIALRANRIEGVFIWDSRQANTRAVRPGRRNQAATDRERTTAPFDSRDWIDACASETHCVVLETRQCNRAQICDRVLTPLRRAGLVAVRSGADRRVRDVALT